MRLNKADHTNWLVLVILFMIRYSENTGDLWPFTQTTANIRVNINKRINLSSVRLKLKQKFNLKTETVIKTFRLLCDTFILHFHRDKTVTPNFIHKSVILTSPSQSGARYTWQADFCFKTYCCFTLQTVMDPVQQATFHLC